MAGKSMFAAQIAGIKYIYDKTLSQFLGRHNADPIVFDSIQLPSTILCSWPGSGFNQMEADQNKKDPTDLPFIVRKKIAILASWFAPEDDLRRFRDEALNIAVL